MRFIRETPLGERSAAALRALYLSLNTPVIAIEELPVGPARAGIALCAGSSGAVRLQVAVRSLPSGGVVAFAPSRPLAAEDDADLALEAGLSFAEGMGFLFDDDPAGVRAGGDPASARAAWCELVGDSSERDADPGGLPTAPDEPLASDRVRVVRVDEDASEPWTVCVEIATDVAAVSDGAGARPLTLSKHRLALGRPGAEAGDSQPRTGASATEEPAPAPEARIRRLGWF